MSKQRDESSSSVSRTSHRPQDAGDYPSNYQMNPREAQVASRFNKQYRGEIFELPEEVEAMPIFQEWVGGTLAGKAASNFWEIAQPKKNQRCLDIGCGVSFLIYPWRDWEAFFYGQEISTVARDTLNSRGSQLNSKLFKGVAFGPAQQLNYESGQFDLVIATGWSCYYSLDYWPGVMDEVKRVIKPGGQFVFDVLNPEQTLAEDWAVLEMYLGADVFLEPISKWEKMIKDTGAKVAKRQPGELFDLYLLRW